MPARAVMVLGTTSGAGKSWLTTALCRWYARQGLKVAPFKAQNMSNNARVVPGLDGRLGEIGSAQYFQALAAGVTPDVRMNPVLLKPEKDTASQVVVMGQVRADYSRMPWRSRSEVLWPHAQQALHSLMADHDVVVIEGAGSPAEINLHDNDFVNMRTALAAQARCLLVTDIDRGGAFAHLFGTWQLLPPHERALIQGFVLNRFRGEASLLAPGPQQLQSMTGVRTVAVLPMWRGHGLPEEDGVFDDAPTGPAHDAAATLRMAVVAYPRISNLDEFQPLRGMPGVRLSWVRHPAQLADVDGVILPGSKHTVSDLAWLRETGLASAIQAHARAGRWVLGICGGLQMLGLSVSDPHGAEADAGTQVAGLGLLDVQTCFGRDKQLRQTQARFAHADATRSVHASTAAAAGTLPWQRWAGVQVEGYEIRHGLTEAVTPEAMPALIDAHGRCLGWRQGAVMGLYLHGLFESEALMRAWFGVHAGSLHHVMEGLADFVDRHFESGTLARLIDGPAT